MFLSTMTSIGLNTGATRATVQASQGQSSIGVGIQEYIYEENPFTVRLFPETDHDGQLLPDGIAIKKDRKTIHLKSKVFLFLSSLQVSLKLKPKSDSPGYVLLSQIRKKLNMTEKQIQTECSARGKKSLIRKQEGQLLRAKPLTPSKRACL